MGLFSREKGAYADIPDEELDWNQRALKKYQSNEPFYVDTGSYYTRDHREQIDGCMNRSLGLRDFDDFLQMKAPRFYNIYTGVNKSINALCDYVVDNLPANNKLQQLQGENNQLKKQCADQKAMIDKLMAQNEKLQNQLIDKVNSQSSSFSR